jgi:phage shock protein PspC (stress-responsive transcriptional regulator)
VEIGALPDVHTLDKEQDYLMTFDNNAPRAFTRSTSQRMLGGVCGGIADYFSIDVNIVRAAAVVASFITGGTAILLYLALWILIPE